VISSDRQFSTHRTLSHSAQCQPQQLHWPRQSWLELQTWRLAPTLLAHGFLHSGCAGTGQLLLVQLLGKQLLMLACSCCNAAGRLASSAQLAVPRCLYHQAHSLGLPTSTMAGAFTTQCTTSRASGMASQLQAPRKLTSGSDDGGCVLDVSGCLMA
jgi:hypothetical protein